MVYVFKNLKQDNVSVQPQSLKSITMTPGKHNYNVQYIYITNLIFPKQTVNLVFDGTLRTVH